MNIPIKVLKTNCIPNEKVQIQQKIAKKYFICINNNPKNKNDSTNKNINDLSSSKFKNIHNIFSLPNLKEEIIRWFFSLELKNKFIISSIENKWLVNCLHFMYTISKNDQNFRFIYLDGDTPENGIENFYNNQTKQPIIFTNKKMTNKLYYHFFSFIDDMKKSNNKKDLTEFNIFNEILFYKTEDSDISNDYCSYFTLSNSILENETKFLKFFDYFSDNRSFTEFIPASFDQQSKYYTYGMPTWFVKKDKYSLQEIFIAFFEQAITVKFVLFHADPNNYNFYHNKYIKNSYLKNLKEEKNYDHANKNFSDLEKIQEQFDKLNSNQKNNINFNNLSNEYGYDYNYNTFIDTASNATYNVGIGNPNNFDCYFYDIPKNNQNNNLGDDYEKNLFNNIISENSNSSCLLNNSKKNFSFTKTFHSCRINLEKEKNYPKRVSDIRDFDCYLKLLLNEKTEIINLFNNEIKNMDLLFSKIKGEKLVDEILEKKEIKEFLKNKSFNQQDFISFNRYSKIMKKVSFCETDKKKENPFDIDLKYFINENKTIEELLNNIIFLDINQIFTIDDIILRRMFDNIYSIYTYKNVLDLLAQEENNIEKTEKLGNVNIISVNNKKKKKNKKKKSPEKISENINKLLNKEIEKVVFSDSLIESSKKQNLFFNKESSLLDKVSICSNENINNKKYDKNNNDKVNNISNNNFINDKEIFINNKNTVNYNKELIKLNILKTCEKEEKKDINIINFKGKIFFFFYF